MRRVARVVAVTVVTLGLTPALQGHAWACSCAYHPAPPTETEQYRAGAHEAKRVYLGTVTAERHTGSPPTGRTTYTVRVTETLKGPRVATYALRISDSTCGTPLEKRKPVLVVDDGTGSIDGCGELTTQHRVTQRAAIVRAALAAPTLPRTGGETPALWLVAVGGALAVARRRRVAPEVPGIR